MDGAEAETRRPRRASIKYRRYTPTWPELPRPHTMTMRGAACRMRSAIAQIASFRASRRSAAAGISAISRAMAVEAARSAAVMLALVCYFANCQPQIAIVAVQEIRGPFRRHPEAEEDSDFYVAVRLFDKARRIGSRATDDLADERRGAPLELRIAGPHVHHEP